MKNKFFKKTNILVLGKIIIISVIIIVGSLFIFRANFAIKTEALEIKSVASTIQADGQITPQNQATLHFQTGGKLVYLPFREGDRVYQGQIIAKLDTAKLEANLRQAEQDFTAAKAASDRYYNGRDLNAVESYDDKVTRTALDAAQNKAYDNVVKARQDIADASLISPINGVITQEDVTVTNVNVTPSTGFTIADPSALIFRANVLESDIDFVSVGNATTITLNSDNGASISGTISKIYPNKITLPTGQKAYAVDIESAQIASTGIMGQAGTALIQSNSQIDVKLVPTWAVLNHDSLWVLSDNQPILRNVTIGKTHGDMIEILDGLAEGDRVITNPESIAAEKYSIL